MAQALATFTQHVIQTFRFFVPRPEDRVVVAHERLGWLSLFFIPFLLLAYLARRPNTYLLRLALLPIAIGCQLAFGFRYRWPLPEEKVWNWGHGFIAEATIAKALEFALRPQGVLKVGEKEPGVPKGKEVATDSNANAEQASSLNLPPWISDTFELAHSQRGYDWHFGRDAVVPKERRPIHDRLAFLRMTLKHTFIAFMVLDLFDNIVKLVPGVGSPEGGSIYLPQLPPVQRYLFGTFLHIITGLGLLAGFNLVYGMFTLGAVGLFGNAPSKWPPVIDKPWIAESGHELWAKRWHQLLRHAFLVYGGYPGKWIAGKTGMIFGTFLASGLYHGLGIYALGQGVDWIAVGFFTGQVVILVIEKLWKKSTGTQIGGWPGRIWVYFDLLVLAQPMNSWHRKGLGGGWIIPPFFSPFKYLLPRILNYLGLL